MTWRTELLKAAEAFRQATVHLGHAEGLVAARARAVPSADASAAKQRKLATELTAAAEYTAPGWLIQDLAATPADTPLRGEAPIGPVHVRLGTAHPTPQAAFPVIVPLLGHGHLVLNRDAADPRVAALLQSLLVRNLAACPGVSVSLVDGVTLGQTFTSCTPLIEAGIAGKVATDHSDLDDVLDVAEAHVQEARRGRDDGRPADDHPYRLVVVAGLPPQTSRSVMERMAALAHAGPAGRVHLILAGWHGKGRPDPAPAVEHGTYVTVGDSIEVQHVPSGVVFDGAPPPALTRAVFQRLAANRRTASQLDVDTLLPTQFWLDSSVAGLSTVVGKDQRGPVTLSFDDATPHWLIGGRTGGGKTVFLLDVLYGLATRYGPRELALYLLDFKEGVSFTEFTPSIHDESWIPQVRAVGVESDREYGVGVLYALRRELARRATAMKRAGVTRLSELRKRRPDLHTPRILAVIDEFHVLFAGNDRLARTAAEHLEELARKGRSYGVHLVLASQTIAGVEALYTKKDSIFGQFPMRVALPGAKYVLAEQNSAADTITLGQAVINDAGGVPGVDRVIRFPDASADSEQLQRLRRELWRRREDGSGPPTVFEGYAEQHLDADPSFARLRPDTPHPALLVGRAVDVDVSTVSFRLEAVPGRNLAVLGTSPVGADVLAAATRGLAAQHRPGSARFLLAPLVAAADESCSDAMATLTEAGHEHEVLSVAGIKEAVAALSARSATDPTYLVLFGGDAASPVLGSDGLDRLRHVLRQGPAKGVHVLGWWRGLRRFIDDIGGVANREDVACMVALNVSGGELGMFLGDLNIDFAPRTNRALAIDRHNDIARLCVPFVRPGRLDEEVEL